MLIDGGKSPRAVLARRRGGPADREEVRLDTGKHFEDLWRGGWRIRVGRASPTRISTASRPRWIYPSVGMLLCNYPDMRLPACVLRRVQPVDLRVLLDGARSGSWVSGQTTLRTPAEGIADLEAIKALGLPRRHAAGYAAERRLRRPDVRRVLGHGGGSRASPSFHVLTERADRRPVRPRPRPTAQFVHDDPARQPGHHRGADLRRGLRAPSRACRVVCVEADAGWAPHWMYRADHAFDRHRNWLTAGELSMAPSEHFREHVYLTFQDDWVAFRMAGEMKYERLMWANDYPAQRRDVAAQPGDAGRAHHASRRARAGTHPARQRR